MKFIYQIISPGHLTYAVFDTKEAAENNLHLYEELFGIPDWPEPIYGDGKWYVAEMPVYTAESKDKNEIKIRTLFPRPIPYFSE